MILSSVFCHTGSTNSCVKILPDSSSSIFVEVGKDFTATCHLLEGSAYTSDDIEWLLGNVSIAKQFYRKINETSVSVTVNISSDMSGWLRCRAAKYSLSYLPPCTYGISIRTGCKCFHAEITRGALKLKG